MGMQSLDHLTLLDTGTGRSETWLVSRVISVPPEKNRRVVCSFSVLRMSGIVVNS